MRRSLTVAWFSFFPVEWLPDVPREIQTLPRGHPATWQRVLLAELEKRPEFQFHVVIVRKHFPRSFSFERNGVTFHLIKVPGGLRALSLFWVDTLLIRRVLKSVQPDVTHAWGTERGAALVAKRLKYPYLVTVQGLYKWCREVGPLNTHERLAAWVERRCLPRAPVVTTESIFSAEYVRRHFAPPCVEQIEHAPDPMFHRIERRPKLSPCRLLFIGGFNPRKGAEVLMRALDRLKGELDFELRVVGGSGGPLHAALCQELSNELWGRVSFKDSLTSTQVAEEMAQAAMLVYPTLVDVSPNVVKEAVVAGLPVVASTVGGIPDYVVPDMNGLLFSAGDVSACVQAVRAACNHGLFGRGLVDASTLKQKREYLSAETMARRFSEVYRRVCSMGKASCPGTESSVK